MSRPYPYSISIPVPGPGHHPGLWLWADTPRASVPLCIWWEQGPHLTDAARHPAPCTASELPFTLEPLRTQPLHPSHPAFLALLSPTLFHRAAQVSPPQEDSLTCPWCKSKGGPCLETVHSTLNILQSVTYFTAMHFCASKGVMCAHSIALVGHRSLQSAGGPGCNPSSYPERPASKC